MQTIIETDQYLSAAKAAGISDAERDGIAAMIASNPEAGDVIVGSGGARKVRIAGKGRGKSGGYRVITYYAAEDVPVFLLDVYSKADQADLSRAGINVLHSLLATLADDWRASARKRARERKTR